MKSIRFQLVFLALFCWFLPFIVIVSITMMGLRGYTERRINRSLQNEINYAFNFATERINNLINLSRKPSYDKYFEDTYKSLKNHLINETEFYQRINKYLLGNYFSTLDITFIVVDFIGSNSLNYQSYIKYDDFLEYKNLTHQKILEYSKNLDTYIGFYVDESGDFYLVRNLMVTGNNGRDCIGTIIFKLNKGFIFQRLSEGELANAETVMDINGANIYLNCENESAILKNNYDGSRIEKMNGKTVFHGDLSAKDYKLFYAVSTDDSLIYRELYEFKQLIKLIFLIFVPILISLMILFYRSITIPISKLIKGIKNIQFGKLGMQVEIVANDEFQYLFDSFNSMSNELLYLFEKFKEEQATTNEAKILALRSQINPHFLNNTLELMNWQARMGNNDTVSKMIEALGTMLDAGMNRANERLVELSQELEYVDAYLFIVAQRFRERLTVSKEIEEGVLSYKLPPLILQPVLENAILHGIEPAKKGDILLKIYREDKKLIIAIINNGAKLSEDDKTKIKLLLTEKGESKRLGIKNVFIRLKLFYGEESSFTITQEGEHTVAKLIIPMS